MKSLPLLHTTQTHTGLAIFNIHLVSLIYVMNVINLILLVEVQAHAKPKLELKQPLCTHTCTYGLVPEFFAYMLSQIQNY